MGSQLTRLKMQNCKVEINDFIGKFTGAFSPSFCRSAIQYFEKMDSMGFGKSRQQNDKVAKHIKDNQLFYTSDLISNNVNSMGVIGVPAIQTTFIETVWQCYEMYADEYSLVDTRQFYPQYLNEVQMQRTDIGGGFHVWHWEQNGRAECNRFMNVTLYLNTVKEGGETEFLYYNRAESAIEGTLLIYPGNYTHSHRGNPPRSNKKYLMATWIEF